MNKQEEKALRGEVRSFASDHATRCAAARADMVEAICYLGGLNENQAHVALATLEKHKLVAFKGGQSSVKHGGALDREVLRRAAGIES